MQYLKDLILKIHGMAMVILGFWILLAFTGDKSLVPPFDSFPLLVPFGSLYVILTGLLMMFYSADTFRQIWPRKKR